MNRSTENQLCRHLRDIGVYAGIAPAPNDYIKGMANLAAVIIEVIETRSGSNRNRKALSDVASAARTINQLNKKERGPDLMAHM